LAVSFSLSIFGRAISLFYLLSVSDGPNVSKISSVPMKIKVQELAASMDWVFTDVCRPHWGQEHPAGHARTPSLSFCGLADTFCRKLTPGSIYYRMFDIPGISACSVSIAKEFALLARIWWHGIGQGLMTSSSFSSSSGKDARYTSLQNSQLQQFFPPRQALKYAMPARMWRYGIHT
jgi:hypothetical protein